jgi:hypothetical protein
MTTTEDVYNGTFGGTAAVDVPTGGGSGGGGAGVAYCTLDQLKLQLGIPADDVRTDDTLNGIIEAVSRLIDAECHTQFYASTDTLFYTPMSWRELLIDDVLSVSSLATDTGYGTYNLIWAPTDFVLAPYNAPTSSQARPYWRIETAYGGRYTFPIGVRRGVMLTARRGFCELADLPGGINAVCLRESLFQAQANVTPYGMTAGDAGGAAGPTTVSLSNYSKLMLAQFKRVVHG